MSEYTISSVGDLGDLVANLTVAKALGKASILVFDSPLCKPITKEPRFSAIKALAESQPYVGRFDVWQGEPITHDCATWRDGGVPWGQNLAQLHANWCGQKISEEPWLKIYPDKRFKNKIVVNRSARHHSAYFPWGRVLSHFKPEDLVFVGLPEEHYMLEQESGVKLNYHPTATLFDVGKTIAASKLFIGNQSSALNVAIGLGKRFLCETCLSSVDCIYKRPDSFYVLDGEIVNFEVEGYEPLNTPSTISAKEIDMTLSPPGSVWYMEASDGLMFSEYNAHTLMKNVNNHERRSGVRVSTAADLAEYMGRRFPNWCAVMDANPLHNTIKAIRELIERKNNE